MDQISSPTHFSYFCQTHSNVSFPKKRIENRMSCIRLKFVYIKYIIAMLLSYNKLTIIKTMKRNKCHLEFSEGVLSPTTHSKLFRNLVNIGFYYLMWKNLRLERRQWHLKRNIGDKIYCKKNVKKILNKSSRKYYKQITLTHLILKFSCCIIPEFSFSVYILETSREKEYEMTYLQTYVSVIMFDNYVVTSSEQIRIVFNLLIHTGWFCDQEVAIFPKIICLFHIFELEKTTSFRLGSVQKGKKRESRPVVQDNVVSLIYSLRRYNRLLWHIQ